MSTAIMPQSLKAQIQSTCSFDNISSACQSLISQYENNMGNVDLYNIYGDCIDGTLQSELGKRVSKVPLPHLNHVSSASGLPGPVPCINSVEASAYFNQPSVMQAMHVKKPPYLWSVCANQISYTSTRPNLPRDTYPALNKFTRVLIYNGDWDACVPYTDNEAWTSSMNYPMQASWHPWYVSALHFCSAFSLLGILLILRLRIISKLGDMRLCIRCVSLRFFHAASLTSRRYTTSRLLP